MTTPVGPTSSKSSARPPNRPPTPPLRVVAAILAGGRGSRWMASGAPSHKLLATFDGGTVLAHAVDAARRARLDVMVVAGALSPATIHDALGAHADSVRIVANDDWAQGQIRSVHAALAAAEEDGYDAVCLAPGDQPFVPAEAWAAVAAAEPMAMIAVAVYGPQRRRSAPTRLAVGLRALLPERADEGARPLLRDHPELVVEVACAGDPDRVTADIDTPEDLARWS